MQVNGKPYRTVWMDGSTVWMINQPLLPHVFETIPLETYGDTARAIKTMVVRGAGAIGAAAAYGMAQVALAASDGPSFMDDVQAGARVLEKTRPTAQDLYFSIRRVLEAIAGAESVPAARQAAVETARVLANRNAEAGEAIGSHGAALIRDGAHVLTHCNAGWLAFVDWGSALAPVYAAKRQGKDVFVFVDETRPRCQGARLTAWELQGEGVDHAVIADNAAGYFMQHKEVDLVIVGADRIAANGDVANKIGTYEKALCASANSIPFYVAAPTSTIDFDCPSGDLIPIEERDADEVLFAYGLDDRGELGRVRLTHDQAAVRNPAFDVTPAGLVTGYITEHGIHSADSLPSPD